MKTETAIVYRGGRRRWFTKEAAARAEAKEIMKRKCECEASSPGDDGFMLHPGYTCRLHDPARYQTISRRLMRLVLKASKGE